jgi:SfnB family sulfur acquisition oxidoreductase
MSTTAIPARHAPAAPRKSYPETAAHIIRNAGEAMKVAHKIAAALGEGAAERDLARSIPEAELDLYSQSGLWGLNIPAAYGGADLSWAVIAQTIAIVSAADPSVGQLIQNHSDFVDTMHAVGTQAQKDYFFPLILKGLRTGNAFSEFGSRTAADFETRITREGEHYRVSGRKYYCSGAYLAHVVPIIAVDDEKRLYIAVADRHAPGLRVGTDWSSFGQRTTVSGTSIIDNVLIPADHVFLLPEGPSANGPLCQIVHAAVDAGIARGAFEETLRFVREFSRPWIDSGQEKATDDPHTQFQLGDIAVRLRATEALLAKAGRVLDKAVARPNAETVAAASIAVAEAKVLSTEAALLATNKLFELGGTRSVLAKYNLDRHWRNARVHTLHDPVRWKYNILGNYYLNGINPPQHSWI